MKLIATLIFAATVTLTANAADTKKLPSGLEYTEIKAGSGAQPSATSVVTVHYRGTLTNGTEFDSSYTRNEPTSFPLNRVIPCWTEGLQLMKVGAKAKIVCPPQIAYGKNGIAGVIPPNSVLNFEIELLNVRN